MNKKILLAVTSIVILIIGALAYVIFVPKTSPTNTVDSPPRAQTPAKQSQPVEPETAEKTGEYKPYDATAVAKTNGTKLLFFHAPWCPQCRDIEASIEQEGLPNDVTVFKVDYDSNQSLRQKYGITLQTTFVKVDAKGNKLASYVAYQEPHFNSVKRALLP